MTTSPPPGPPLVEPGRGGSAGSRSRRLPPCRSAFSALVLMLLLLVSRAVGERDPINDFCRRFGHQTAVIDRKLYIDGGLVNWNPLTTYPGNYSNKWLLYQDLDHNSPDGMPQIYANPKNDSVPSVSGGILWADDVNKKFYLFGGEYYHDPVPDSFVLYAYDALYDHWDSLGPPSRGDVDRVSFGAGVAVQDRGEGYYYGGWISNNSVSSWSGPPLATNGLIKYDMDSNMWRNSSGPEDGVRRAEGAMTYIPAGDAGMLVYLGGVTDPYANGTVAGQPLSQIFIYDVLSSKWYTQESSGTVPGMRRRFCAGVTWPQDQSSYNIYVYGGASMPPNTTGYDDVYVLSMPSFTWTKLYPNDGNFTGEYPHHSSTCNVISNAQMLIIGGTFPSKDICDEPASWGTHNLDMGEQNPDKSPWAQFQANKTSYAVPDAVVGAIGGSAAGGATKTAPAGGWGHQDLKVLMARKASVAARTPTRAIPTPTGQGSPGGPLSTGAIAGIAVGVAAAAIAALLALCFFVRRHRKQRRQQQHKPPPGASFGYSDSGGAPGGAPWSSQSSHYTPTSPYPTSPFVRQPAQAPVELAASGPYAQWRDGSGSGPLFLGGGSGYSAGMGAAGTEGSSGAYEMPKVDEQGRVWMPQVSSVVVPPPRARTPTRGEAFPSPLSPPGFRRGGRGGGKGSSPLLGPQELSPDPAGDGRREGDWSSSEGRVHQTYYHP